ncbi:MAG: cardiolipin synthase [Opitutaceae bacterium]
MYSLLNLLLRAGFPFPARDWIVLGADLLSVATIPSVLVRRSRRPLAALSWILVLLAIPLGGLLAWWLLGRTHLQRPARKRKRTRRRMDAEHPELPPHPQEVPQIFREVLPFALQGDQRRTQGVFPPAEATGVQVFADGAEAYAAFEAAIAQARTEIRALYYIWQPDETGRRIAAALAARARAGVAVRILVDEVGSRGFLRLLAKPLRAAGAEVAGFLPASFRPWAPTFNFRNHRKLLLVDGRWAFTGGMNIGREYERDWSDQCIRLSGPALRSLDEVFQEDWFFATNRSLDDLPGHEEPGPPHPRAVCVVIASGPDRMERRVHDGFFMAIMSARRRIWLTTPYFVPDASVLDALRAAAMRGVDVRILAPRRNDVRLVTLASRSCYEPLLQAGVRVFEYLPRFQHTKNLLVDDELAVIGSANVDTRSFRLNFELACFLASRELNRTFGALFEEGLSRSQEVRPAELSQRSLFEKCLESAANLLSPLL